MTAIDTARAVLAKASLFDQTFATPDLGIAVAWSEALGDLDQSDALRVVTEHYATQTRRLMPADVIAGVRRIRGERLRRDFEDAPELDAVADDPIAYNARLRAHRRAVADGRAVDAMFVEHELLPVEQLVRSTAAKLPRLPKVHGDDRD